MKMTFNISIIPLMITIIKYISFSQGHRNSLQAGKYFLLKEKYFKPIEMVLHVLLRVFSYLQIFFLFFFCLFVLTAKRYSRFRVWVCSAPAPSDFFFLFSFYGHTQGKWKFPGQGLNPICTCNIGSFNPLHQPRIKPTPLQQTELLQSDS